MWRFEQHVSSKQVEELWEWLIKMVSCNLRKKLKVYSITASKSILLLQLEHGFCQQNGIERVKVQDWHPNEKMMVVFVCLNSRWYSSECMNRINRDDGNESLPLLAFWIYFVYAIFLKYSKKAWLSLNQAGIRNISSDVCYNDTKHYEVQSGKTGQV